MINLINLYYVTEVFNFNNDNFKVSKATLSCVSTWKGFLARLEWSHNTFMAAGKFTAPNRRYDVVKAVDAITFYIVAVNLIKT